MDHEAILDKYARMRRFAYAGLWIVVTEIIVVMAMSGAGVPIPRIWIWVLLLGPAGAYLIYLWRACRCPVCGASLLLDAGPYQRLVFNLNAKSCPRCGATLT